MGLLKGKLTFVNTNTSVSALGFNGIAGWHLSTMLPVDDTTMKARVHAVIATSMEEV